MKKYVMAFLLCLCARNIAQAQVKFGIKSGVNISSYNLEKSSYKAYLYRGFYVGPSVRVALPILGLGLEGSVLYEQKESEIQLLEQASTYVLKQKQLSVPLHLRYGVGLGSVASVFVYAGPQFSYNLNNDKESVVKDVMRWKFNKTNLSVNLGLGAILFNHLQLSVGYNKSVGSTEKVSFNDAFETTLKGKVDTWQVGVGYWF